MTNLYVRLIRVGLVLFAVTIGLGTVSARAQESSASQPPTPPQILEAARELMEATQYCALITVGADSRPQIRTMNPFTPDEHMVVWMATNSGSRKVADIKRDARVTLYYADHTKATGFVSVTGRAELVDDMQEILKRKRAYWDQAFPGLKNLVLIKVIPERIDVLNYKRGISAAPATWRNPAAAAPTR